MYRSVAEIIIDLFRLLKDFITEKTSPMTNNIIVITIQRVISRGNRYATLEVEDIIRWPIPLKEEVGTKGLQGNAFRACFDVADSVAIVVLSNQTMNTLVAHLLTSLSKTVAWPQNSNKA